MVDEALESYVKKLELRVQKNEEVIVGLRGLIKALLARSTWTDQDLKDFIEEETRNPVGPIGKDEAVSAVYKLIEETEGRREKNRQYHSRTLRP